MNSFFGEDTIEEEKLIKNILTKKDENKLPKIIEEIVTSHLVKTVVKPEKEEVKVKSEQKETGDKKKKETVETKVQRVEVSTADQCTYEEKINLDLEAHIFPFHVKKNRRINYDMYFIPYKSIDNKDVITQYTYSYDYYDIYSDNIEYINQTIHLNKHKKRKLEKVTEEEGQQEEPQEPTEVPAKRIKTQEESVKEHIEKHAETTVEEALGKKDNPFEKWLVHFRGRLFVGNKIKYPILNINTYLAVTKNLERNYEREQSESPEESLKDFRRCNKTIETYNMITSATYWRQDEFPGIKDPNIQKLLFFTVVPPMIDDTWENELEEEAEELTF